MRTTDFYTEKDGVILQSLVQIITDDYKRYKTASVSNRSYRHLCF